MKGFMIGKFKKDKTCFRTESLQIRNDAKMDLATKIFLTSKAQKICWKGSSNSDNERIKCFINKFI